MHLAVEAEVEVIDSVEFTTENTVWMFRPGQYKRVARTDREELESIDGKLANGEWFPYERLWAGVDSTGDLRIRVLPAGRPPGSKGVVSGPIIIDDNE